MRMTSVVARLCDNHDNLLGYVFDVAGTKYSIRVQDLSEFFKNSTCVNAVLVSGKSLRGRRGFHLSTLPIKYVGKKSVVVDYKSMKSDEILYCLHMLDNSVKSLNLRSKVVVTLCGSAVIHLLGYQMRTTMDVDVLEVSDNRVLPLLKYPIHFAGGVVGLLEDYTDRIEKVPVSFNSMIVYCLSLKDLLVSKLASPKFSDIENYGLYKSVDLQKLYAEIKEKYTGISMDDALMDVRILQSLK